MASSNSGVSPSPHRSSTIRSQSENRRPAVSPLVQASLQTDLENDDALDISEESSQNGSNTPENERRRSSNLLRPPREYSLANFYRRPSTGAAGSRLPFSLPDGPDHLRLSGEERERLLKEERGLLRTSHLLPPKSQTRSSSVGAPAASNSRGYGSTDSVPILRKFQSTPDVENSIINSETTPLLGNGLGREGSESPDIDLKWEEAVLQGLVQTSWQREAKVLARNSAPLIVTFLLQYSLNVTSIFTVGRIGRVELGAVSLATSKF
jgi:MATE family multidrug resistance protein